MGLIPSRLLLKNKTRITERYCSFSMVAKNTNKMFWNGCYSKTKGLTDALKKRYIKWWYTYYGSIEHLSSNSGTHQTELRSRFYIFTILINICSALIWLWNCAVWPKWLVWQEAERSVQNQVGTICGGGLGEVVTERQYRNKAMRHILLNKITENEQ